MEFVSKVLPFHIIVLACLLLKIYGESISFGRSTYIVHMQKSVMPKAFLNHQTWYSSIIDSLKFVSPISIDQQYQSSPSILYMYDHALHGFSASLSLVELRALKKHLGFILVYKDQIGKLYTTRTPEFLSLNPAFGLWPDSNYGEGSVIGIVDSGIWPESISFKDHNMTAKTQSKWNGSCEGGKNFNSSLCNLKIIGVRYFDKGLKKEHGKFGSTESARDTIGHGTLISSIAAGNYVEEESYYGFAKGTAKGVAPLAKLSIYKVGWGTNIIVGSDILAGMDQAISDGVDVISVACGGVEPSIATASFSAMEKGIVVTVAAGNEGPGFGTLNNDFPWVITVTASTIDRWFAGILTLGNGETITGWSMYHENESLPPLPLVYDQFQRVCNSPELLSRASYGIIICHGGHNIANQVKLIANSSLSGAIFIFREPMLLESLMDHCPCVAIRSREAPTFLEYVSHASHPTASITFKQTIVDVKPAPIVASYSPKGPSKFFPRVLKPDVIAPGSLVLASSIPKQGSIFNNNYTMVSGTSFVCPHVVGVTALLKVLYPKWSAAAIRSAIMTSANELDNNKNPIRDYLRDPSSGNYPNASPLAIGAGHINANQALDPGLIYDATPQDYVNLMCTLNNSMNYIKAITRSDLYDCSKPSFDLNYPSFITFYTHNPVKTWTRNFTRTVTNVGEGAASYKAKIKSLESFKVTVLPGTLVFGGKYVRQSYTLTLENQGIMKHETSFGHLLWEEQKKSVKSRHKVRSPIVVINGIVPKPKNLLDPKIS